MSSAVNDPLNPPPTSQSHSCNLAMSFVLKNQDTELYIKLEDSMSIAIISAAEIGKRIVEQQLDNFKLDDDLLAQVLEYASQDQAGLYLLGYACFKTNLELELNDTTNELSANITLGDKLTLWNKETLKQYMENTAYNDIEINQEKEEELLAKLNRNSAGTMVLATKPEFTQVKLKFEAESSTLSALLIQSSKKYEYNQQDIQEMLVSEGYDKFEFETNAISKLLTAVKQNDYGEYPIATRKNAEAIFDFDKDMMKAYISLKPPAGGREMDRTLLDIALKNAEIDSRACDQKILDEILEAQEANHVQFASGKQPENGSDTQFVALIEETISKLPDASATGKIDTKDLHEFTIVDTGTKVMRRVPPQDGVGGYNVKGQVIPAVDGIVIEYEEKMQGVARSEDDPEVLVATTRGHPVILKNGVNVDKTLTVNNVAMSTGHITFDGSLLVRGEVMPGMKINVTGDIVVEGVVTNATLRARNNITVKCGVIGADPDDKDNPEYTCHLKAGGDISAQYVTQTKINAGHDLHIREYISHCIVDVRNKLFAGSTGGKGRIFGGDYYAQAGIESRSIGAEGVKTQLTVGSPRAQQKQYEQLIKSQDHRVKQLEKLDDIFKKKIAAVKKAPSDQARVEKAKAVKKVVDDLKEELAKIGAAVEQIEAYFRKSKHADIVVFTSTFENVTLTINGASFMLRQEGKGGRFEKQGRDIRWTTI